MLDDVGLTGRDRDGFRTFPGGSNLTIQVAGRTGGPVDISKLFELEIAQWAEVGLRVAPRLVDDADQLWFAVSGAVAVRATVQPSQEPCVFGTRSVPCNSTAAEVSGSWIPSRISFALPRIASALLARAVDFGCAIPYVSQKLRTSPTVGRNVRRSNSSATRTITRARSVGISMPRTYSTAETLRLFRLPLPRTRFDRTTVWVFIST